MSSTNAKKKARKQTVPIKPAAVKRFTNLHILAGAVKPAATLSAAARVGPPRAKSAKGGGKPQSQSDRQFLTGWTLSPELSSAERGKISGQALSRNGGGSSGRSDRGSRNPGFPGSADIVKDAKPLRPLARIFHGIDPPRKSRAITDSNGNVTSRIHVLTMDEMKRRVTSKTGDWDASLLGAPRRKINLSLPGKSLTEETPPVQYGYALKTMAHAEAHEVRNGVKATVLHGSDYLTEIKVPSTSVPLLREGRRLFVCPIAPFFLTGTRLAAESQLFQEAELVGLSAVYVPDCGTGTPGTLIMFQSVDSAEANQIIGVDAIRNAQSHDNCVMFPVWQIQELPLYASDITLHQFTSQEGDPRLQGDGVFTVMCGPGFDNSAAAELGSIHIKYVYRFYDPAVDLALTSVGTEVLTLMFGTAGFPLVTVASNPVVFSFVAPTNAAATFQLSSTTDPRHKLFYGVVVVSDVLSGNVNPPWWYTAHQGAAGAGIAWDDGAAFWFRVGDQGDDPTEYDTITVYETFEAAMTEAVYGVGSHDVVTSGRLRYSDDGSAGWKVQLQVISVDLEAHD